MRRRSRPQGPRPAGPRAPERAPDGRVVARRGPVLYVERDAGVVPCVARGPGKAAVVGDRVWCAAGEEGAVIADVAPRRSVIIRADALGDRPQVIAANVDVVFVVSAVEPPLREGLIDRYLVAAHAGGAAAEIVLNKTDLFLDAEDEADFRERLSPYPPLGYAVHFVSAESQSGLDRLRAALAGRLGIFVGHSGVGKTSLLNALSPGLGEKVQELSEGSGRGRHTTTHSEIFRLASGGEVIDSPGIRAFGLWDIAADQVKAHFVEMVARAEQCRFADCQHDQEPGCAVKAAVEAGEIAEARYESYLRIRDSLLDEGPH